MRRVPGLCLLAGCVLGSGLASPLLSQVRSSEFRTRKMELVGYNGEIATKTPELLQLVVQRDYAYIGSIFGPAGLFIVDISDPRKPTLVSEFPQPDAETHDVKVNEAGTIAVLANQWVRPPREEEGETWDDITRISHLGLTLVDISDKRRPRLLSRWENHDSQGKPAPCHNVEIYGNHVYCTGLWWSDRGLVILDISDPTRAREVATIAAPPLPVEMAKKLPEGDKGDVFIHDIYVTPRAELGRVFGYAAWWEGGLHIYDLTDPTLPAELAAWAELGRPFGIAFYAKPTPSGRIVVVGPASARGFAGFLSILDVSDLSKPKLLSTWSIPGHDWILEEEPWAAWSPANFDVTEDRIYLANYWAGVWVIDISDPREPHAIANFGPESFYPPPPKPEGPKFWDDAWPWVHTVEEQDGLIYALDVVSGLYILRITE